jgi:cadmium resistance protein CadD (predicted permease)
MVELALGKVLVVAILSFIATIVDDIAVLIFMYGESIQPDGPFRPVHVVVGEYLGFTTVVAIRSARIFKFNFQSEHKGASFPALCRPERTS